MYKYTRPFELLNTLHPGWEVTNSQTLYPDYAGLCGTNCVQHRLDWNADVANGFHVDFQLAKCSWQSLSQRSLETFQVFPKDELLEVFHKSNLCRELFPCWLG
mmetsp:Transcript_68314/g.107353  ORF Transcript_68314/g.107353 Transcript_68314/m.107353 type:complete len:103 (-) Transcript_68314:324-632(-)